MSMWQGPRIPEVTAEEASAGRTPNVLLDVRWADEWEAGHAPNAVWMPLGRVESARFELPINRRIVCVCRIGERSARAAAVLAQMGFDAVNLTGGMVEWQARGLPVVRDDGTPGTVI
ncbi:MAG: rhodanese-like domain-containing protein [Actinomycetota bacterium]